MRYLVTGEQMKEVDRYSIEQIGIPSLVLMERAALAVFKEAKKHVKRTGKIWVLCGSGNNGADGVATARMFALAGYDTLLILAGEKDKGSREYLTQIAIAEKIGVDMVSGFASIPETCDLFIDALFGVGLDREIKDKYRDIMERIHQKTLGYTVAVDLPSGIHSDTGQIMGMAFRCDLTVTFGVEKLGTMLYPGREYANQVLIADIGFPSESIERVKGRFFTFDDSDRNRIPKRPAYSNKGDYGKVLIVAGSKNMSGAALLSALAAYRTGAGMVKIFTVEENRQILQIGIPEAVIVTYNAKEAEDETEDFTNRLLHHCNWASAIVLGPGLGQEPYVRYLVEVALRNANVPLIIDADGLNVIASDQKLTGYYTNNTIITPHLGEMARLTGLPIETIQTNLIQTARDYADRYGITCILKDAATIGALNNQETYINHSGNSGMAKAGAGDVLTGIIAGLLAMGMKEWEAAALGVWLHGCAGDKRKEKSGSYSLLARELTDEIYTMLQK